MKGTTDISKRTYTTPLIFIIAKSTPGDCYSPVMKLEVVSADI